MAELLTEHDLIALTGSRRTADQRRILASAGIVFIEKTHGQITTTWTAVHAAMHPNHFKNESPNADDNFNIDALR
ncbi:DUF4224 domain-containing protein [Neiella marina]|uniref:DUF4224 domain-containing protein n=1 Tax=Neiella holothuriorum TaxID=2870530 RepID=A0ABS7EFG3_9GAMM|nr:DUF4224 domain-containing protein [Neiella holothuriorum]MBW8190658.1 DUF4224 domain-containing protein [Neiella holothuriorum]